MSTETEGLRQRVAELKEEVALLQLRVESLKAETTRLRKRLGMSQTDNGNQAIRDLRTERYGTC